MSLSHPSMATTLVVLLPPLTTLTEVFGTPKILLMKPTSSLLALLSVGGAFI